jgi:hypothetical protein
LDSLPCSLFFVKIAFYSDKGHGAKGQRTKDKWQVLRYLRYMKYTITVAFIAFVLLSSTCKKAMQVPDPELEKIFGKWSWVRTSGGFAGKTITPVSEGYTARFEFNSDGTYKKYKNETLTEQKKFSFLQATSINNHQPVWVISFDGSALKMAVSFSGNDTLILNEQAYDGFSHTYIRMK